MQEKLAPAIFVAILAGCQPAPQGDQVRRAPIGTPSVQLPPPSAFPALPASPAAPPLTPPPEDLRVAELALGAGFTCVRTRGQGVHCWGENNRAQLGDGTIENRAKPQKVPIDNVAELGAGNYHVCARHTDGTVSCWGAVLEGAGQQGDHTVHPAKVPEIRDVERLVVGMGPVCAFLKQGRVQCWGGSYLPHFKGIMEMPQLSGALRASLDQFFGCFQWQEEGEVRCWCNNSLYHVNGNPRVSKTSGPMPVEGLPPVHGVTTGWFYACALTGAGHVMCWGNGPDVLFGREQIKPMEIPGLSGVTRLALSTTFLCALRDDGSVICMGSNKNGQLGDGTTRSTSLPRRVLGIEGAVDIGVGESHACAITRSGTLWCWGGNKNGQLGDGTTINRPTPIEVHL